MCSKGPTMYRIIRGLIDMFYPKYTIEGLENIPEEPSVFVGNHSHAHGPIVSELRLPFQHCTWCIGQILDQNEARDYIYTDFWSAKPPAVRWIYRLISFIVAHPLCYVLRCAGTIPVYKDNRVMSTMKKSIDALSCGNHLVIYPEHYKAYNHFLCEFQSGFIDTAKLYYKRTGKQLLFVPMYIAPRLHKIVFGKAVRFDPSVPIAQERERINSLLMDSITQLALEQPPHTVVPYPNISRRNYPHNTPGEELKFETPNI